MENLNPDFTLIIQLGIIIVLWIILSRLFFKPISALLKARKDHVEGCHREEDVRKEGIAQLVKKYDAAIEEAKAKAIAERELLRKEAVDLERALLDKAHEEHAKAIHDAKEKAKSDFAKAKISVDAHVKELSKIVTEKMLQRRA